MYRKRTLYLCAILFSALLLITMGLINKFPLTFNYDTAMYIESGVSGRVGSDRPILYGLFMIFASFGISLWLAVVVQALIVSLLLFYYFRYFSVTGFFLPYYIGFVALISFFMSGSYEVSWLMPDVFTAITILCAGLILFPAKLKTRDAIIVSSLAVVSIGMHNSHFYICMMLSMVTLTGLAFKKIRNSFREIGLSGRKIAVMVALAFSSYLINGCLHFVYKGDFKSSRGGSIFLMSNMIEMGIMEAFLDETCEKYNYRLCPYKDSLPNNFLWADNSPIRKTGGWRGNEDAYAEMEKHLLARPRYLQIFIYKSAIYTLKQFFNYDMSDIQKPGKRVNSAIKTVFPNDYGPFLQSRQSTGRISFGFINYTQDLIAGACLCLYAILLVYKRVPLKILILALFILLAMVLNAWICSTFSGVYPRYQTRVIWLLPLPLCLFLMTSGGPSGCWRRIRFRN